MHAPLEPIRAKSLTEVFVQRFEELIFSGRFPVGRKLPSERELALQLGGSRPVVHEGLVHLAAKGLVTLVPRVGTVVNDYRKEGSLPLLTSLLNHRQGRLAPEFLDSLLEMRLLFEVETAGLAARNRTAGDLAAFAAIIDQEQRTDPRDTDAVGDLDFRFHHRVALASGNLIYPLLLNSFKQCHLNLAGRFFRDPAVVPVVFDFHLDMVKAIDDGNEPSAVDTMSRMLAHGGQHLKAPEPGNAHSPKE